MLAPHVPVAGTATASDASAELRALLDGPSLAEEIEGVSRGLIAWATPSVRPGVADPLELSVSTAAMRTVGGERLGAPGDEDGPFGRAARLAALAFGADHAHFGVNGSSGLNHVVARVLALAPAPHVLLSLNAHHSLLDALVDMGVTFSRIGARYAPELEALEPPSPRDVEAALQRASSPVTAIVLSTPTYEGLNADIERIAALADRAGAVLVVDAAWGSHAPFLSGGGPLAAGADIIVTSLHKTGGARQQNALLLHRDGSIAWEDVRRSCAPVTTTSPSYPMLSDIDATIRWLLQEGQAAFARIEQRVVDFGAALREKHDDLEVLGGQSGVDPLRVTLGGLRRRGLTGYTVCERLAHCGIVAEKRGTHAITFLAPLSLTDAAVATTLGALQVALSEPSCEPRLGPGESAVDPFVDAELSPAVDSAQLRHLRETGRVARVALGAAAGRVSASRVELYPPGIPLLIPGFRIAPGAIAAIADGAVRGATIGSTSGGWDGRVDVLAID